MARMLPDDRKDYRRLALWAQSELPLALGIERTRVAFLKHSGLEPAEAELAVARFDTDPWLHVRGGLGLEDGAPINAQFQSAMPNRIVLSRDVAQHFEEDSGRDDAKRFLEAKVLHEMVHWANFNKNIPKIAEAGKAFESAAYDKVLNRWWPAPAAAGAAGNGGAPPPASVTAPLPPSSRGLGGAYPNHSFPPNGPRGLRNNNPGNLKKGIAWKGLLADAEQADSIFLQFSEMVWGIRAMARCLRSYKRNSGIRSIAAMSRRWAPSIENDPGAYARIVVQHCRGVAAGVDDTIDLEDAQTVFGVARGIMFAENGAPAETVPDADVRRGIELERTA